MRQAVFIAEFVGDVVKYDSGVFLLLRFWRLQAEIGGVEAGKFCSWSGQDAVYRELDEVKRSGAVSW